MEICTWSTIWNFFDLRCPQWPPSERVPYNREKLDFWWSTQEITSIAKRKKMHQYAVNFTSATSTQAYLTDTPIILISIIFLESQSKSNWQHFRNVSVSVKFFNSQDSMKYCVIWCILLLTELLIVHVLWFDQIAESPRIMYSINQNIVLEGAGKKRSKSMFVLFKVWYFSFTFAFLITLYIY